MKISRPILIFCSVIFFIAIQGCASHPNISKPVTPAENNKIILTLNHPAKIMIYKGTNLIEKLDYQQAGTYTIDTSSFPDGTYQLVVQSSGGVAQFVTRESFSFTKPSELFIKINTR